MLTGQSRFNADRSGTQVAWRPDAGSRGAGGETTAESAPPIPVANPALATAATPQQPAGLHWNHVKAHRWDALWYFCGAHPSGFSTTATLRAEGFTDPARVSWFVRQGADKVYAPGGFEGPELTLHSSAGSRRADDVHVEVQESAPDGTVTTHLGTMTVRAPHRLRQEWTAEPGGCPPGLAGSAGCTGLTSEINYRILDNFGGTIVGATVNELFPSAPVADQPNNWTLSTITSGSAWRNTNGTFTDTLFKCCGSPAPVPPADTHWGDKVLHQTHEFYVGSATPGQGCLVQRHTLQYYRGTADHEDIHSPVR